MKVKCPECKSEHVIQLAQVEIIRQPKPHKVHLWRCKECGRRTLDHHMLRE